MSAINRHIAIQILRAGRSRSRRSAVRAVDRMSTSQLRALYYFSHANRHSRTVSAFAKFSAVTQATASVIVKRLEKDGYLTRQQSSTDRRRAKLTTTQLARRIARYNVFEQLTEAIRSIPESTKGSLSHSLSSILHRVKGFDSAAQFGICKFCLHRARSSGKDFCTRFRCAITRKETEQICQYFSESADA